jgi:hypothetical protein
METQPFLDLELTDPQCSYELRFKFKAGNLHMSYKAHPEDKYPDLWQMASLTGSIFNCKLWTSFLSEEDK